MNLSDLMHRATADLEPESLDLFERSIRSGMTRRRRRATARAAVGAGAVVATAVAGIGGGQLLQDRSGGAPAASTSPSTSVTSPSTSATRTANTVTPEQTLQTLKAMLPGNLRVFRPRQQQDETTGVIDVSVLIDDGKGPSELSVQIGSGLGPTPASLSCADRPDRCYVRPDGSAVTRGGSRPDKHDPSGLLVRTVIIQHANDTTIAIANTNTTSSTTRHPTRPQPVFSHARLLRMADSGLWKFPRQDG